MGASQVMVTLSRSMAGAKIVGALGTDCATFGDSVQAGLGLAVGEGVAVAVVLGV